MKKIKIFLASSNELKTEREKFEIQVYRKSKLWADNNIFLHLEIWEDLSSTLSETRSQDEYNKRIKDCDLFVLLAYTKLGVFTGEEFETAFGNFNKRKKPFILTYFKEFDGIVDNSLVDFKKKLEDLGHFYNDYSTFEELWISFNKELDLLLLSDFKEFVPSKSGTSSHKISNSRNTNSGPVNTGGGNFHIGDNISIHLENRNSKIPYTIGEFLERSAKGDLNGVKTLLNEGMSVDVIDDYGETALMKAVEFGHKKIVDLILENGAEVNKRNNLGYSAIRNLAYSGDLNIAKTLIEYGASVNDQGSKDGDFTLARIAGAGYFQLVKLFVENGADINLANKYGWTALHQAALNGHLEIVKYLLAQGAEVNNMNPLNDTALLSGTSSRDLEIVKLLLEKGANTNIQYSIDGRTPLMNACQNGDYEIAKILLEYGANPNLKNKEGNTALEIAKKNGFQKLVELLKKDR